MKFLKLILCLYLCLSLALGSCAPAVAGTQTVPLMPGNFDKIESGYQGGMLPVGTTVDKEEVTATEETTSNVTEAANKTANETNLNIPKSKLAMIQSLSSYVTDENIRPYHRIVATWVQLSLMGFDIDEFNGMFKISLEAVVALIKAIQKANKMLIRALSENEKAEGQEGIQKASSAIQEAIIVFVEAIVSFVTQVLDFVKSLSYLIFSNNAAGPLEEQVNNPEQAQVTRSQVSPANGSVGEVEMITQRGDGNVDGKIEEGETITYPAKGTITKSGDGNGDGKIEEGETITVPTKNVYDDKTNTAYAYNAQTGALESKVKFIPRQDLAAQNAEVSNDNTIEEVAGDEVLLNGTKEVRKTAVGTFKEALKAFKEALKEVFEEALKVIKEALKDRLKALKEALLKQKLKAGKAKGGDNSKLVNSVDQTASIQPIDIGSNTASSVAADLE